MTNEEDKKMTNLGKLLENDSEKLADVLIKEYIDVDGFIVGYYGPHGILHSIYDPNVFDIATDRTRFKEIVFSSGPDIDHSRTECKEAIITWLKQPYVD